MTQTFTFPPRVVRVCIRYVRYTYVRSAVVANETPRRFSPAISRQEWDRGGVSRPVARPLRSRANDRASERASARTESTGP